MSLVGNLEDLSLGDILQIISLSQKSGVLVLDADQGSGRVVFANGLVRGACLKGDVATLRDLVLREGLLDEAGFEAARRRAEGVGAPLEEVLAAEQGLGAERLDALVKATIEAAVFEMFRWPSGSFSFDVRSEREPGDPDLLLPHGVNAQYLAMEGMRLRDEQARDAAQAGGSSADLVSGPGLEDEPDLTFAFEEDPGAEHPRRTAAETEPLGKDADEEALGTLVSAVLRERDPEPLEATGGPGRVDVATVSSIGDRAVVVIDPEIAVLDWVKGSIQAHCARVHVFQQAEQGLARIRQYLIRGELPLVLLSLSTPIDPLSGIHGLSDFVKRLKAQAERLCVLGLREVGETAPRGVSTALDGLLDRPPLRALRDATRDPSASAGRELVAMIGARLSAGRSEPVEVSSPRTQAAEPRDGASPAGLAAEPRDGASPAGLAAEPRDGASPRARDASSDDDRAAVSVLREVTARLQQASSRGEVLPVVLDFAARLFARAAILAVRDQEVFAVAGRGIPALEVDPLSSDPALPLRPAAGGLLARVLESGEAIRGAPDAEKDGALLARFGSLVPRQAYLAPIQSAGRVVALLYADGGAGDADLPDSSGLEVVLHHAGLALDRAALERALREREGG